MKRSRLWILLAVVLFGLAAWLMWRGEGQVEVARVEDRVTFPRALRGADRKRMETRKTLEAPFPVKPDAPPPVRDPMLAALPRGEGKSVVVVEANALRNSPIGELLLDCLRAQRGEDSLARMKEQTGVDFLQDLDRVAVSDGAVVMSGQFGQAKWDELKKVSTPSAYGQNGTVYEAQERTRTLADGGTVKRTPPSVGVWKDQLVVMGRTKEEVQRALDQVEGRGVGAPPPINEGQTYGEIYGVLSPDELARVLPADQAGFAERLKEAAQSIELHVDASKDVGVVADVKGNKPELLSDLGKSMGAALSVARLKLQAEGQGDLAQFLDLARVRPQDDGRFSLEMALPLELLQKQLAWCRERGARDAGP